MYGANFYQPHNDLNLIIELTHSKDLIDLISKLRDVYSCIKVEKIIPLLNMPCDIFKGTLR